MHVGKYHSNIYFNHILLYKQNKKKGYDMQEEESNMGIDSI